MKRHSLSSSVFAPLMTLALAMFLVLGGCTEKESKVHLNVTVKTNQGDPIDAASISLDGEKIGASSTDGSFAFDLTLPVQARKRLEVKKDSEIYYFAPFFESFVVSEAESQDVSITATLYFVPKPTTTETADTTDHNKAVEATEESAAPVAPLAPKVPEVATATKAEIGSMDEDEDNSEIQEPELGAPQDTKVALTPVSPSTVTDVSGRAVYPKPNRPNKGETIFTVHVVTGDKPISDAQIFLGQEGGGDLKSACVTNPRGRCVVRFQEAPEAPVTFVAKKKGFQTKSATVKVAHQGQARLQLAAGQTIDIFAITKSYNHILGLANVEVYVKGKHVGSTDQFGHYAHTYYSAHGAVDDLVSISLKPKGYLPEIYETDFIATGPMTLVRYFTPVNPPAVRMTLLQVQLAGQISKNDLQAIEGNFDETLQAAVKKNIYSLAAFKEFPLATFNKTVKRLGHTSTEMMRSGWQGTDLKASVDALLLPTLLILDKPVLELSVIDSKGQVLAAAKEELESLGDKAAVDRAVSLISKKIVRVFPFEGAVLAKSINKATINLGYASGRGLKVGDTLEVYGMQAEKLGRTQSHKQIAMLMVRDVDDEVSRADVNSLVPRATVERGDLVVLRTRRAPEAGGSFLQVQGNVRGIKIEPLPQANVYLNDQWLGSTDESGRYYFDVTGSGMLKVIKYGYQQFSEHVNLKAGSKDKVLANLRQQTAFLRVESKPAGATVKIDGVAVGKTPLAAPIAVPAGFLKLEVEGPAGYQTYSTVLELERGTLDLSGDNTVVLEQDMLAQIESLIKSKQYPQAIAKLAVIPKEHSQYLQARHMAGEIYLTYLNQPAKAAEAFGEVTSDPSVKLFSNKRFIGSHINEGIALFMTAEKLTPGNTDAANAHYEKAIEVLTAVEPQLRFVPVDQYPQAVHNVDFHIALARHRLWLATRDNQRLVEVVRSWRNYIDGSARTLPVSGTGKIYMENARVYYRQAQASLGSRAGDQTN